MPAGSGTAALVRAPARLRKAYVSRGLGLALILYGTLGPDTHPETIMSGAMLLGLDQVTAHAPQNNKSPEAGSSACRGF